MTGTKTSLHLGALLTESGLLDRKTLDEALRIAEPTGLPVGRVLIMISNLREQDLQSAVQAQSLLKDGLVELPEALSALRLSVQHNVTLETALKQSGWLPKTDGSGPNKLGTLLLEAGIINQETLDSALAGSFASGLPLGRFLVLIGAISENLLSVALNAQILIRDAKMQRQRAIEGLKAARLRLEAPLLEKGQYKLPSRHKVKLGELFLLAGIVSETDLMNALELGLTNQQPIGQVLIAMSFIDEKLLHAALKLQEAVSQGFMRPLQAGNALTLIQNKGITLQDAIADTTLLPPPSPDQHCVSLRRFLKLVGTVSDADVDRALKAGMENSQIMGKMLLLVGAIDESTLQAAWRCDALVRAGLLTLEQACMAFNCSQQQQITIDEALQELGWTERIALNLREREKSGIDISV